MRNCLEAPAPTRAPVPTGSRRVETGSGPCLLSLPFWAPPPWPQDMGVGPVVLVNKGESVHVLKLSTSGQQ